MIEFLYVFLAIIAGGLVLFAFRKGFRYGFKIGKEETEKLEEPKVKIAFQNGRDETLKAFSNEIHEFKNMLKSKRSKKVIEDTAEDKRAEIERMREQCRKEIEETRLKAMQGQNLFSHQLGIDTPTGRPYLPKEPEPWNPLQDLLNIFLGRK